MLKEGREAGGALDQAAGGSGCSSVSVRALARLPMGGALTLLALPYALVLTDQRCRDAATESAGFPLWKLGSLPGFTRDGQIAPRLRVSLPSRARYRSRLPCIHTDFYSTRSSPRSTARGTEHVPSSAAEREKKERLRRWVLLSEVVGSLGRRTLVSLKYSMPTYFRL